MGDVTAVPEQAMEPAGYAAIGRSTSCTARLHGDKPQPEASLARAIRGDNLT